MAQLGNKLRIMRLSEMEILRQEGPSCSTTCIAMITGNTPEYIQKLAGGRVAINAITERKICEQLGLKLKLNKYWYGPVYESNPLPPTCLVTAECRLGGDMHLMCRIDNMFYDTNRPESFYTFDFNEYSISSYREWETVQAQVIGVIKGSNIVSCDTIWYVADIQEGTE